MLSCWESGVLTKGDFVFLSFLEDNGAQCPPLPESSSPEVSDFWVLTDKILNPFSVHPTLQEVIMQGWAHQVFYPQNDLLSHTLCIIGTQHLKYLALSPRHRKSACPFGPRWCPWGHWKVPRFGLAWRCWESWYLPWIGQYVWPPNKARPALKWWKLRMLACWTRESFLGDLSF